MDFHSKTSLKNFLKKYDISPSKRLGQNFLIDKSILKKFLTGLGPLLNSTVLEIGPGLGIITKALAKGAKKVIAVEKDERLCQILRENLKNFKNLKIIQGDILKIEPKTYNLKPKNYKVVGNLPFYLTAPVIRKFLESPRPPKEMILIIQKEVAQRICAKPPKMNLLAVSVQFYAQPKIIDYISKKSFWPQPKVDAAIIKLKAKDLKLKTARNGPGILSEFFWLVRAGFSQPRKKLVNNLAKKLGVEKRLVLKWLKNAKIKENSRAENLNLRNWILLAKNYFENGKKY